MYIRSWQLILVCALHLFLPSTCSMEPSPTPTPIIITDPEHLRKFLCKQIKIAPENCTCEALANTNITIGSEQFSHGCDAVDKYHNKTQEVKHYLRYEETLSKPYAAISVVAFWASAVGNGLVLAVTWSKGRELSDFKRIIALLAASDLIFSFVEFIRVVPTFWTNKFLYGAFMCKFLSGGIVLGANIAIGAITIISVERYFGIVHPMRSALTKLLVNILLLVNVLVGVATVVPIYIYADIYEHLQTCRLQWPHDIGRRDSLIYNSFQLIVYTVCPVVIISSLYTSIVVFLSKAVNQFDVAYDPGLRKQRCQENRRAAAILFAVVAIFTILVAPYRIALVYLDIAGGSDKGKGYWDIDDDVFYGVSMSRLFYPIHVAVNPIIYCMVDSKWRKDVQGLFCDRLSWKRMTYKARTKSLTTTISNASCYQKDQRSSSVNGEQKFGVGMELELGKIKACKTNLSDSSGKSVISDVEDSCCGRLDSDSVVRSGVANLSYNTSTSKLPDVFDDDPAMNDISDTNVNHSMKDTII